LQNPVFQRFALAVLPAMAIGSIALFAVWGDNGLFARHRLAAEMRTANMELATLERRNQALVRELQVADQDPIVLERMVAEELGWGRQGSVIFRFDD
jgi:cell division protein FtsB